MYLKPVPRFIKKQWIPSSKRLTEFNRQFLPVLVHLHMDEWETQELLRFCLQHLRRAL